MEHNISIVSSMLEPVVSSLTSVTSFLHPEKELVHLHAHKVPSQTHDSKEWTVN